MMSRDTKHMPSFLPTSLTFQPTPPLTPSLTSLQPTSTKPYLSQYHRHPFSNLKPRRYTPHLFPRIMFLFRFLQCIKFRLPSPLAPLYSSGGFLLPCVTTQTHTLVITSCSQVCCYVRTTWGCTTVFRFFAFFCVHFDVLRATRRKNRPLTISYRTHQ